MIKTKRFGLIGGVLIVFFVILVGFTVPLAEVFSSFDNAYLTKEDVQIINKNKPFGTFVSTQLFEKEREVGGIKTVVGELWFKLFGFLPIKKATVQLTEGEEVYIGGNTLGFHLETSGVLVIGENKVETAAGFATQPAGSGLQKGDVIISIDDFIIKSVGDIVTYLSEMKPKEQVSINILRKNKPLTLTVPLLVEKETEKLKLGIWARDDASGIGTLTYVKKDGRFGALGHAITDFETGAICEAKGGTVHKCSVVGISKGKMGSPGELKGLFLHDEEGIGSLEKNTPVGVYGNITKPESVIDINKTARTASRLAVVPGKAKIASNISGIKEEYDIEIIKATKQNVSLSKGMVLRVTDKRLLALTGGIVQGMSGSPILQNGKVVGAVTHVFVSDPTKGYGIYIDWMKDN